MAHTNFKEIDDKTFDLLMVAGKKKAESIVKGWIILHDGNWQSVKQFLDTKKLIIEQNKRSNKSNIAFCLSTSKPGLECFEKQAQRKLTEFFELDTQLRVINNALVFFEDKK